MAAIYYHSSELPWSITGDDERRFRRIMLVVLLSLLVFSVAVPYLPLTKLPKEQAAQLPPRMAKLILERKQPPPPKVEQPKVEQPKEPPKPKEEPKPKQEVKPQPKPEPAKVQAAREKAKASGVLAFSDELADLRSSSTVDKLAGSVRSAPGAASGNAQKTERSMITSGIAAGSGGINTGQLSRDTGGTQLASRQTTRVESPVGETQATRTSKSGRGAGRTPEEIQLVFDRNKSTIDALYRRALRADPTLRGKVVLKLTIAPSGEVTACSLVSSELGDEELERKIVQRVKLFNFGPAQVETVTLTYPIEFFPA